MTIFLFATAVTSLFLGQWTVPRARARIVETMSEMLSRDGPVTKEVGPRGFADRPIVEAFKASRHYQSNTFMYRSWQKYVVLEIVIMLLGIISVICLIDMSNATQATKLLR